VTPDQLAAAVEEREASPIALVVILLLLIALVLLIRSMNRHLRKVPGSFRGRDEHGRQAGGPGGGPDSAMPRSAGGPGPAVPPSPTATDSTDPARRTGTDADETGSGGGPAR